VRIEKIEGCNAHVSLTPDDLLLLANACECAVNTWDDGMQGANPLANPTTQYVYTTLASTFEALAFAADATGRMVPKDARDFARNTIARGWHVMPGLLGGAQEETR
jgi:hypothetical protein